MSTHKTLIIGAGTVIIALIGAYFFFDKKDEAPAVPDNIAGTDTSTSLDETPGYTIEQVPVTGIDIASFAPSLERRVVFSASVPADARVLIQAKADTLQATLKADITNVGAWFDLAVYYHTANDYDGAREVWEFLTKIVPQDPVAYENLGKMYHFSLRDYPKAESNLNKALALDPDRTNPYIELANLYQYSYKQDTNALFDLLDRAIKRFPGNTDFIVMLGEYYERKGDAVNARKYFTQALDLARDAGNLGLVSAMGAKLEKLP